MTKAALPSGHKQTDAYFNGRKHDVAHNTQNRPCLNLNALSQPRSIVADFCIGSKPEEEQLRARRKDQRRLVG